MRNFTKPMDDQQTDANSPKKRNHLSHSCHRPGSKAIRWQESNPQPTSETQKQLLSRDLVREIMQKEKNRTIRHQIGKFDRNLALYAKPQNFNPNQFKFDCIPTHNPSYSSLGSAKIQEINKGLKSRPTTASVRSQKRYTQKSQPKNISKVVDSVGKRQARVSVSGLVTYKFCSVNAERSIGLSRINRDQKLSEQLKKADKSRDCSINRLKNILFKQTPKRYNEYLRKQNLFMSNFNSSTDDYLKQIKQENEKEEMIYGEKAKKLDFIKDYMAIEKTSYQDGRHIIDEIEKCKAENDPKTQRKKVMRTEINEDLQFERRKMPILKKRLKVRYLTFVE